MSKRRVGNEIGDLSDKILSDLEPERRLQFVIETKAEEKDQWTERLIDSCPRRNYRGSDRAFVDRLRFAQRIIELAVYELYTTYLQYKLTRQRQSYTWLLDHEKDEEPTDDELDQAAKRAKTLRELFAQLYADYHVYQRFAVEVLDVDLEAWAALHHEGPLVFEVVGELIDDRRMIRLAESHLIELLNEEDKTPDEDQVASEDESVTLEEMVDIQYKALASAWADAVAKIPS